ncbi:MAG: PLD nuclease N-terminal domain-containing protein [Candidatus Omnitrophica bacterium]|nr:PLD nuclease N-terminal domain-containing protein [Candidatus Omnitrophota bacterium]MBU1868914.1 PLD nuclease N-terminal domain-containing protein [Candidatus Omnitrophota bacterium]
MATLGIIAIASFWILGILLFIFWIKMIIDCAKREFANPNDKVIWIIVICLLQILGALIYWFVIKQKDKDQILVSRENKKDGVEARNKD